MSILKFKPAFRTGWVERFDAFNDAVDARGVKLSNLKGRQGPVMDITFNDALDYKPDWTPTPFDKAPAHVRATSEMLDQLFDVTEISPFAGSNAHRVDKSATTSFQSLLVKTMFTGEQLVASPSLVSALQGYEVEMVATTFGKIEGILLAVNVDANRDLVVRFYDYEYKRVEMLTLNERSLQSLNAIRYISESVDSDGIFQGLQELKFSPDRSPAFDIINKIDLSKPVLMSAVKGMTLSWDVTGLIVSDPIELKRDLEAGMATTIQIKDSRDGQVYDFESQNITKLYGTLR